MSFNYKLENFVGTPTNDEVRIRIYNKYNVVYLYFKQLALNLFKRKAKISKFWKKNSRASPIIDVLKFQYKFKILRKKK